MKKKVLTVLLVGIMAMQLVACSLEPTCKASDCEETEIYQDGYCKYHHWMNQGEQAIKDFIN